MVNHRSNPQYFTYQDYDAVKKSFVYEPDDKIDMSFVSGIMEPIRGNTPRKERMLYDTFHEFKKLIIRHYSFLQHGKDKCCNYINYWLNKTVRDSKFGVDEKNFDIFDKFMRVDAKIKDSPIDCISKLSYMKKDVFEKMKKLYDLYDYFTKLKESKVPTTLCHHISDLAEKYESIMKEYEEKDHNLCKMLTILKDVIVKDELVAKDVCTMNTSDLFYLKIDPPRKEQKAVMAHAQVKNSRETPPPTPVSGYSAHAHGRKPGEKPPPTPVSGYSAQVQRRKSVETSTPPPVRVSSSPVQGLEKPARGESERISPVPSAQFPLELTALSALPPLPLLQLGQLKQLEQLETEEPTGPKGLPEQEPELPQEQEVHIDTLIDPYSVSEDEVDPLAGSTFSTFNAETIMEKMKIAVSKVLETVEPVPVLGVSGAIGALFLLFKCTPIGSIFRRKKRSNQNIPNFFDPENGEQYSDYYPESDNEDFPNNRVNIAYNPSSDALD